MLLNNKLTVVTSLQKAFSSGWGLSFCQSRDVVFWKGASRLLPEGLHFKADLRRKKIFIPSFYKGGLGRI